MACVSCRILALIDSESPSVPRVRVGGVRPSPLTMARGATTDSFFDMPSVKRRRTSSVSASWTGPNQRMDRSANVGPFRPVCTWSSNMHTATFDAAATPRKTASSLGSVVWTH